MHRGFSTFFACLLLATVAWAQSQTAEEATGRYLEAVRKQPAELVLFLRQLPKGGDLHNHLSGAVYAESYIGWAAEDGLCVDLPELTLQEPPCDAAGGRPPASAALENQQLYDELIDAFSIRNFPLGQKPVDQHFFDAFLKFDLATKKHRAEMLAEVVSRAGAESITYLELISPLGDNDPWLLGEQVGWDADLGQTREKLLKAGIRDLVEKHRRRLDQDEARMRGLMGCGTMQPNPGCDVVVRHIFEVHRAFPPQNVFAEMLFGFELAHADPRVVSVNPVMAEAAYISRRDYDLHMRMFEYLVRLYPDVQLTLHAGELAPGLAPPEALQDHIWKALVPGSARRIGHGEDALWERNPEGLMQTMAQRQVAVEVCPTSYRLLLSSAGIPHPLPIYLKYGVPVVLSTDDIGVSRSDTTREYLRAVEEFDLSYAQLKTMIRNSLEYAFLDGESLWEDAREFRRKPDCRDDDVLVGRPSDACQRLLDNSGRARLQWNLERDLARFERKYAAR